MPASKRGSDASVTIPARGDLPAADVPLVQQAQEDGSIADPDTPDARGGKASVIPAVAPGSGRGALDSRRIIGAAVEFINAHGLRALTMRRLGAELGVEAMALYRYVPGREQLLDGIVEAVIDELYGDPDVYMEPRDGWQDYLQRIAHGVRRIALAHAEVFPLIATRPPAAPWVRPPLRSLRWVESFLDALVRSGFSDAGAAAAYRAFSSFLLGHLLLEVSQQGVDVGPVEEPDEPLTAPDDLSVYPHIQRLQGLLSEDHAAAEFEESLENLLGRLELLLPAARRRH